MPLNYIYIHSKNPVDAESLANTKNIPLFIKNEKMRHFPMDSWETAVTTAAEEAKANCNSSQVYLIYTCIDMKKNREWSHWYDTTRYCWFQEPNDLSIIQIQPVGIEDKKIVRREQGFGKISGELHYKPFHFVPEPKFNSPLDIADLERNIRLYLLYRTGEERGHIAYLRKFGPFKGFSAAQKKMTAEKLLSVIAGNQVAFTEKDLRILNNGLLGKATLGFENLVKIRGKFKEESCQSTVKIFL